MAKCHYIMLVLLIPFSFGWNAEADEDVWSVEEEIQIGDYAFRCLKNQIDLITFDLLRSGKTIYSTTKSFMIFEILPVGEPLDVPCTPSYIARDLTDDGTPELAIVSFTGGAHCCFGYDVFSIGETFKHMVHLEDLDVEFTIRDIDGDRKYEYEGSDDTFNYWNACHADSPFPKVVLRYEGGELHLAEDLMKQLIPKPDTIEKNIPEVRQAMEKLIHKPMTSLPGRFNEYHPPLWTNMLDLIYTGNAKTAEDYFETCWPEEKPGKDWFFDEFKKRLSKSPYLHELKRINKDSFLDGLQ